MRGRSIVRFQVAASVAVLLAGAALAQSDRVTLEGEITASGYRPIPIAIPDPIAEPGSEAAVFGAEIVEAIRFDLGFTGFFDIVDPTLYRQVPDDGGDTIPHVDWESIGADALVRVRIRIQGLRLDVEVQLFDNPSQQLLLHKRYGGTPDLVRRIAHQASDHLVKHYTGSPGIAKTQIAFVSKHEGAQELYLMDYDGRRVRRLTTTGTTNLTPAWSGAGDAMAFVSWRGINPGVYILWEDGRLERAPTRDGDLNAAPEWSPDGTRMVYSGTGDGNSELYLLDLASRTNTRLTRTEAIETAPVFSPAAREIAFTSDRSGTPQIYIMDAEGLNVRRLTYQGSYNDSAAWSPSGDRLAYVSRVDGRFDVFLYELATGEIRRLTRGEGNNENPRWSPDGRHVVFASSRRGTYDIYTMRSDGSHVIRLTKGGDCFTPDWSR